jgi:hypothetical protein
VSSGDAVDGSQTGGATTTGASFATKNDFLVFAVAAVDVLGNVGPPGGVVCGTPRPSTTSGQRPDVDRS